MGIASLAEKKPQKKAYFPKYKIRVSITDFSHLTSMWLNTVTPDTRQGAIKHAAGVQQAGSSGFTNVCLDSGTAGLAET